SPTASAPTSAPIWTAIFSLPLSLSWPLKMGLISYVLALPPLFLALAYAIRLCGATSKRNILLLALWLAVGYCAHPFPFGLFGLAIGVCWLVLSRQLQVALKIVIGCLPALCMLAWDVRQHSLDEVPGMSSLWPLAKTNFTNKSTALARMITRAYGIANVQEL